MAQYNSSGSLRTLKSLVGIPAFFWFATFSFIDVSASSLPEPAFATAAPRIENVIEEQHYFYRVLDYTPAVPVVIESQGSATFDHPEALGAAQISAMLRGDFETFQATWDERSRQQMILRDRGQRRGPEFWLGQWQNAFAERTVQLKQRIESGPYVILAYEVLAASGEALEQVPLLVPCKQQSDGRWLATQELTEDPVLSYWNLPGHRVQKMARGIDGR